MKSYLLGISFFISISLIGQELTGAQLLDKAIVYHDPMGNWKNFNGRFNVTLETPNNSSRLSEIIINLPAEYFQLKATRDTIITEYSLKKRRLYHKNEWKRTALRSNFKRQQS